MCKGKYDNIQFKNSVDMHHIIQIKSQFHALSRKSDRQN